VGLIEEKKRTKILLVEDDKLLAKLMTHRLQKVSFEVISASNGLEAIEKAEGELPDLILMDVRLPLLDGWEATKKIKLSPYTAHIPIIALTAQSSALDRQRSLAAGCDEYVAKPVQFATLLHLMESLLQKVNQGD
jgi:two-component system, cell cycle response regulator DivK